MASEVRQGLGGNNRDKVVRVKDKVVRVKGKVAESRKTEMAEPVRCRVWRETAS